MSRSLSKVLYRALLRTVNRTAQLYPNLTCFSVRTPVTGELGTFNPNAAVAAGQSTLGAQQHSSQPAEYQAPLQPAMRTTLGLVLWIHCGQLQSQCATMLTMQLHCSAVTI